MHLWYFPGGGWVGEINNKDHLSPAEAGHWAELGYITVSIHSDYFVQLMLVLGIVPSNILICVEK